GRSASRSCRGRRRADARTAITRECRSYPRAQSREAFLQLDPHRLVGGDAHEVAELLLEAEPLVAAVAALEMLLRFANLLLADHAVHVRLHHLLAVVATAAH